MKRETTGEQYTSISKEEIKVWVRRIGLLACFECGKGDAGRCSRKRKRKRSKSAVDWRGVGNIQQLQREGGSLRKVRGGDVTSFYFRKGGETCERGGQKKSK